MPFHLISCDTGTNYIYRHSGISSTISFSFLCPAGDDPKGQPIGLTFDGLKNLVSSNDSYYISRLYVHSGVSDIITDSFGSAGGYEDLAFDGTNLLSAEAGTFKIYVHVGVSGSIISSFSIPSPGWYVKAITYDGANAISATTGYPVGGYEKVYIHSGLSSTVTNSFLVLANPQSLAFSGNLLGCDVVAGGRIIIFEVITEETEILAISATFPSPAASPTGIALLHFLVDGGPAPSPGVPTDLLCEQQTNPIDVTDPQPEFSAIYHGP